MGGFENLPKNESAADLLKKELAIRTQFLDILDILDELPDDSENKKNALKYIRDELGKYERANNT